VRFRDGRGEGRSGVKHQPGARAGDIRQVLAAFGLKDAGEPRPVEDSVLGDNFRIGAGQREYFVQFKQEKRTLEVVEAEHRAMRFAAERGIPVAMPLEDGQGRTAVTAGGRVASVAPWIHGHTARRGAITAREAASLGDMQGRLQRALAEYRDPVLDARDPGESTWDTSKSLAELRRVEEAVRSTAFPEDERTAVLQAVGLQTALLEGGVARPPGAFADAPTQIEHGDYHERNVILSDSDDVLAVIDWERVRRLPRAFQMVRAVDFMGLVASGPLDAYLEGYGRHVRLERGEAALAVDHWWQNVLHNTWTQVTVFLKGDVRPARFLPELEPRLRRLADEGFRRTLAERIARFAEDG
jgi:Ser/Thr protein kinase RdoA (MazF antagonist)